MEGTLDAFRRWGYLEADLDPLGRLKPQPHPDLAVECAEGRRAYCGPIGVEFMHLPYPDRCRWIAGKMESNPPEPDRERILDLLIRADIFEQSLQSLYIGSKRFSLEGATAVIPLLAEILDRAEERGVEKSVIGMSHRGRLNVLHQIVGVSAADLFAKFEDVDPRSVLGSGDVKYHLGATGEYGRIQISLVSNPSHLEAVVPVAMGRARAKQDRLGSRAKVLPIILHGDAAFAGQGITAESLNLADLRGFTVGGTVHVIVDNLIGFTTEPRDLHSSPFASDVAKRLPIPIFHVNGEDPDAVVRTGRIALEYRMEFASDVVVDVIGYRRHGHSEVDDPTATQPRLYREIAKRPPLWKSYAKNAEPRAEKVREELKEAQVRARAMTERSKLYRLPDYWEGFRGGAYDPSLEIDTRVADDRLRETAVRLTSVPPGFSVHPKVARLLEQRREMGEGKRPIDWGMAEQLAFGSLLAEGVRIRMSGQDSRRGTFNQRHAVLIDVEAEEELFPLAQLGRFECFDSVLSEAAVVGYEYGYSRDYPEALVLWEAQFGDFANGAQIILDQFVAAGEDKWGLLSGLVLLLPHGYEGQGPEHSSARIERFLQLAGEDNLQIAQPSTAAQYFHLLRRQALRRWRKPLVVFTPKSMLRHPGASSPLEAFTSGRFSPVLPETSGTAAKRVIVCTGKIGHELREERRRCGDESIAIVMLEQLYPFPERELRAELGHHTGAREIVWVQEEPANMGALFFVMPRLEALSGGRPVRSIKRSASASPATGSAKAHAMEQATLLALAFAS